MLAVPTEGHDLRPVGTGRSALELCETEGTRWFGHGSLGLQVRPRKGVERVDLSLVATLAFFEPMNSGRGGKRERVPVGVEGGAPASASGK